MSPHEIYEMAKELPLLEVTPDIDVEEAMRAVNMFSAFNDCHIGLVQFTGETAWERHPAGDELLFVLAGQTRITLLEKGEAVTFDVAEGSMVIVPRGLWHSQRPCPHVTLLFVTPIAGSERSTDSLPADADGTPLP